MAYCWNNYGYDYEENYYGYDEENSYGYNEEENYHAYPNYTSEDGYYGDASEWCCCSKCEVMAYPWEQNCCHSHGQVVENMREYDVSCITYHPGFQSVVLDPFVLETAYYSYRMGPYRRGKISNIERGEYRMYRYVAYRQFVRWCWGMLGHENRVDLPSCVIIAIRNMFPPGYSKASEYL